MKNKVLNKRHTQARQMEKLFFNGGEIMGDLYRFSLLFSQCS